MKMLIAATATVTLLLFAAIVASATISTVYDELIKNGFPPGILPNNAISYSLGDNGDFEVDLSSKCYVKFTDLVYYDKKVKGKLTYGIISDLNGIEVKRFFAWLPLSEILVHPDGKHLEFKLGFMSIKLPTSLFNTIPNCSSKKKPCRGFGGSLTADAVAIAEA